MQFFVGLFLLLIITPASAGAQGLVNQQPNLITAYAKASGGWFPAGPFIVATNSAGQVGFRVEVTLPLNKSGFATRRCEVKFILDPEDHEVRCSGVVRKDLLPRQETQLIRNMALVFLNGWIQGRVQSLRDLGGVSQR
ncbi:MAG: hypothetical protein A2854_00560 [Parcubacteria group bacterium RIFCSPHIGHO2_01_FULL_56_18]|nr:MAG: hypothetical protein A2854_00560 [Parcubacteria group bacterium RIFCSPHIGHO2_01_FULL_56_18]